MNTLLAIAASIVTLQQPPSSIIYVHVDTRHDARSRVLVSELTRDWTRPNPMALAGMDANQRQQAVEYGAGMSLKQANTFEWTGFVIVDKDRGFDWEGPSYSYSEHGSTTLINEWAFQGYGQSLDALKYYSMEQHWQNCMAAWQNRMKQATINSQWHLIVIDGRNTWVNRVKLLAIMETPNWFPVHPWGIGHLPYQDQRLIEIEEDKAKWKARHKREAMRKFYTLVDSKEYQDEVQ